MIRAAACCWWLATAAAAGEPALPAPPMAPEGAPQGGEIFKSEWCFCILPTIVPERLESAAHTAYAAAMLPGGLMALAGTEPRGTSYVGSGWTVRTYTASGKVVWTRSFVWQTSFFDVARAAAADTTGRLFVAGYSEPTRRGPVPARWLVAAYGPDGAPLWHDNVERPVAIRAEALAVEPAGNAAVVGWEDTGAGGRPRWLVRKYGRDGAVAWSRTLAPGGTGRARAVTADGKGGWLVAGTGGAGGVDTAWVVTALTGGGEVRWTRNFASRRSWLDEPYAVAAAADGRIGVVGKVAGPAAEHANWMVRMLDAQGRPVWDKTFDGEQHKDDKAYAALFDGCGRLVVAGYENGDTVQKPPFDAGHWAVRAFDREGAVVAEMHQEYLECAPGSAYGLAVDAAGTVAVAGFEQLPEPGKMRWSARRPAALKCKPAR